MTSSNYVLILSHGTRKSFVVAEKNNNSSLWQKNGELNYCPFLLQGYSLSFKQLRETGTGLLIIA